MVLGKIHESPLDCKDIKPVNPNGNQSWIFTGRTDVGAKALILWPPDAKNWLIGKDPDTVKDWRQEEKRMTKDEMIGWHHWLDEHELEKALGDGEGQGSLECCSPWGCKESDMTETKHQHGLEWKKLIRGYRSFSMSWLMEIVLRWTLGCMCPFELWFLRVNV